MGTEKAWPRAGTGLRGMVGDRAVELGEPHGWRALDCDVTDAAAVRRAVAQTPAEVVVHFAAFTDLAAAHAQTGERGGSCYRVNVDGTRNLAHACRENDKYLIHVSTDYVFSGAEEEPYRESDVPAPQDWYSRTKYWAEGEVRGSGCRFSILRPSFPFRARYARRGDIVRKMISGLTAGRTPPMFCDTLVSPVFVDEFVAAIDRVAELRPPEGLFHCAGGTSLSPYDLAVLVARVFDLDSSQVSPGHYADYARTSGRPYPRYLNISNERAAQVLGIRFSPIEAALETMRDQLSSAGAGTTAAPPPG